MKKKIIFTVSLVLIVSALLVFLINKNNSNLSSALKKFDSNNALLNNGYEFKDNTYYKEVKGEVKRFGFANNKNSYYQICIGKKFDNCFTFYWERKFVEAKGCSYDLTTGIISGPSTKATLCNDDEFGLLVTTPDEFNSSLGIMKISNEKLEKLRDFILEETKKD